MIGRSLRETLETVTPNELAAWTHHLSRYPLNEDKRLHILVAQIWVLLAYWCGAADKSKPATIYDVAPWLRDAKAEKHANEQRNEHYIRSMYAQAFEAFGLTDNEDGDDI